MTIQKPLRPLSTYKMPVEQVLAAVAETRTKFLPLILAARAETRQS